MKYYVYMNNKYYNVYTRFSMTTSEIIVLFFKNEFCLEQKLEIFV